MGTSRSADRVIGSFVLGHGMAEARATNPVRKDFPDAPRTFTLATQGSSRRGRSGLLSAAAIERGTQRGEIALRVQIVDDCGVVGLNGEQRLSLRAEGFEGRIGTK